MHTIYVFYVHVYMYIEETFASLVLDKKVII